MAMGNLEGGEVFFPRGYPWYPVLPQVISGGFWGSLDLAPHLCR